LEEAIVHKIDAEPQPVAAANSPTQPAQKHGHLPLLSTVAEVHRLSGEQAKLGYPVHLSGVVTYYDVPGKFLFFQDATAGVFIFPPKQDVQLKAGQRVELDGLTGPGDFAPVIVDPHFRILGEGAMPAPPSLSLEDLFTGNQDSNWVEAEGLV